MQFLWPRHPGTLSPAGVADAFTWPRHDAPYVRAVMVATADGAAKSPKGLSGGISSAADRLVFATIRGLSDVILVGAETVRSEGYGPVRPRPELVDRRAASGQAPVPRIAIVTRSGNLDLTAPLVTDSVEPPLIFTTTSLPADRREALAAVAEVIEVGESDCEPDRVIAELGSRGLNRIACEGGPSILGQFMGRRLIDELCLTVTPLAYGGTGDEPAVSRIIGGPPLPDSPRPMRLAHVMESDGTLFLRYTAPI